MTLRRDESRAQVAATVRAVKHWKVLVLEVRSAFHRLRSTDANVQGINLLAIETKGTETVELLISTRSHGVNTVSSQDALGHAPRAEREGNLKDGWQAVLNLHHLIAGVTRLNEEVAERGSVRWNDAVLGWKCNFKTERAHDVGHNLIHLHSGVGECLQRGAQ